MTQTTVIAPKKKLLMTEDEKIHIVCAYCRVSTDEQDQKNSLFSQQCFFERYFQMHKNWKNVGIYADEGLSGTSLEKREQFTEMLNKARLGTVDIILTKEVSRFSRNVQHLLNTVEELRNKGVYIWFLSDDINTERDDYREKITQIATNAEQESLRTSRRVRWGQRQQMQIGTVFGRKKMYGYEIVKDACGLHKFEIIEEEAETVRKIFKWISSGDGISTVIKRLQKNGINAPNGKNGWTNTFIRRVLKNEKYVGDLLQGKTYTPDPLTHKKKYNRGESYMFYIKDHHSESAIIDRDTWNKVQSVLNISTVECRDEKEPERNHSVNGKIYCGLCGRRYVKIEKKQKSTLYIAWNCIENSLHGNEKQVTDGDGKPVNIGCNSRRVNGKVLKTAFYDLIKQILSPCEERIFEDISTQVLKFGKRKDENEEISELNDKISETKNGLAELALKLVQKSFSEEIYRIAVSKEERKLAKLQALLLKKKEKRNISYHGDAVKHLEKIWRELFDAHGEIYEEFYGRTVKKTVVHSGRVLEIQFSFASKPLFLKYETQGRGENYSVRLEIVG